MVVVVVVVVIVVVLNSAVPLLYRSAEGSEHYQPSIPLTGDSRADADIIAFYKARQKLIQKGEYCRHSLIAISCNTGSNIHRSVG